MHWLANSLPVLGPAYLVGLAPKPKLANMMGESFLTNLEKRDRAMVPRVIKDFRSVELYLCVEDVNHTYIMRTVHNETTFLSHRKLHRH